MKPRLLVLSLLLLLIFPKLGPAQGIPVSAPVGLWDFDNPANLGQATVGPALTVEGATPAYSATLVDDGGAGLSGVMTTVGGTANRLRVIHGIPGNGGSTTFVNEYTLLFDVFSPVASRSAWRSLYQTNTGNSNDAEYFIRNSNDTLGRATIGYSGTGINDSRWTRIVVTVDLGTFIRTYVNGVLFHTHTSQPINGGYSLDPQLLFFADENNENAALNVGAVALWGKPLTAAEVQALGGPGAQILGATLPNQAPVITEGTSASLTAALNNAASITLHVTDAEGNPITWTVSGAASNGTAAVTASSNTEATITYTPALNYTGPDSFTVKASDGPAEDTIVVNVNVQNSIVTITSGASYSLTAAANGGAQSVTFHANDSGSNPLTWTISSASLHGTAQVTGNDNTSGTIAYTPAPGYFGPDSFTVRAASGGGATDEITVLVQVVYSSGSLKNFYSQNFDSATLLPEVTTGAERRMPVGDNTPVWNTPEGSGLGLSSGANVYLNPENDRVVEFTGFNLLRTDFWRNGDDQGRSTAFAAGTNVVAVADSDEYTDGSGTGGGGTEAEFNVFLRTPVFAIPAGASANQMVLSFLSSFRVEEDETARVRVYLNGNSTPAAVLTVPNNGANPAAPVTFTWAELGSPAAGSTMQLEFGHEDADNNWWWAFDEIYVGIPNQVPVITEGATAALNAQMNGSAQAVFHVTDGDNDAISWTITTAAAHGTAQITTSSNTEATITYTPTLLYAGPDTFTVQASDGGASDSIVVTVSVQNGAPVISEGETYNLGAVKNGGARSVTFHATDPNGNPLSWTVSAPALHGATQVTGDNNTEATISYTPDVDYSGTDSFTVTVSDGLASDSILVNVSVTDPSANPKLTIVASHGTATPAAGVYSHPRGTALTNSVTDEIGATTRHLCTGWSMIGDGPNTGSSSTMNMILTRDSVLTWLFRTEHRVETAVAGIGTVDLASGWYEAGIPLQITATPGPGQYFAGWTGDTTGCQIGGKTIVIPMDRPRATVTANFAVNENFTFIALPDTQNYTSITSPTDLYTRQTQWILNNKQTLNIRFVTHLGDIVNSPSSQSQWQRATDAMNLMNTKMPYGTCPGNHDLATGDTNYIIRFGPNPTHASSIGRWIDPADSQTYDWYRGSSPRGYSSYQIVTVNGRDYMFLHMDMDAPDQDLAWAAGVLAAHPKTLTMVTTHNYLAESGGSGTYGSGTGQRGYTAQANISIGPDRNRPLDVFNAIVKPFNQVYMVICGHNFATYNLQKTNDAGNIVHEIVVDWQSLPNGGNAFLRIMEFRPAQNLIYNTSYSPYLGRYVDPNNNADHQGMLDLHDRYGSEFALTTDFDTRFNSTLSVPPALGSVTPGVGTHEIEDGTPVAISAREQIVGQTRYRPIGWNLTGSQTASGTGASGIINHNGDATLNWTYATEHYLTTATTGAGIVSTNSGWYAAGTTVSIQAQPDAGSNFIQWSGDTDGCTINGPSILVPIDRPRGPVTAQFTPLLPTYSVQVVSAYPSVSPAAATYTYEQGQSVTFSATDIAGTDTRRVCTGYSVTGAVTQSGSGNSFTLPITGNITVTWNWKTQYLLTTTASGPGTVNTGAGQWVDENGSITVTATAGAGAGFVSWSGDTGIGAASGNQFTILGMTRPVNPLTANFTAGMHTLTVVSSESTVTPAAGTHSFPFGTTVNFSAVSAESGGARQRPTGWALSGAATNSGAGATGSFVITGDTTLTWSWTPEVLLAISAGTEGMIQPMDAAGWHPLGSSVTLGALPSSWFGFRAWTGDVAPGTTSANVTLVMDQPRSVTADIMPLAASDGTPHWWLNRFTNVSGSDYEAARLNDSDGDGQRAGSEFIAGMSDLDANQRLRAEDFAPGAGGATLELTIPTRDGRVYQLTESASLFGPFAPTGAPIIAEPPQATISFPRPATGQRFYKVEISLGATSLRDADPVAASHWPLPGSLLREMKRIPAGTFTQGENTGPNTTRPTHVTYVSGFFMDKFEVTRADWETVATWAQAHGYDIPVTLRFNQPPYVVPADHPAVAVSWYDAVKWCNARSEMEGRHPVYFTDINGTTVYRTGQVNLTAAHVNWAGDGYRLPTEAEWERASRGGLEGKAYPWGDGDASVRANHWDFQIVTGRAPNSPYPYTERVGYFDGTQPGGAADSANAYGLYDMVGNAWEWTWDRMGDYSADKQYDPRGPDTGSERVQRGGAWWNYVDQSTNFLRLPFPPDGSDDYGMIGFRCIRAAHPNE